MAALPYMQFFVADYLADTMHLTAEEHGAYLLLIFNYWQTGKPLPNDDKRLRIISKVDSDRWVEVKQTLMEFFVVSGDKVSHPRIEADLEFIEGKQKKAVAAGKASALSRAAKKKKKDSTRSTVVPTGVKADVKQPCQLEANHSESDSKSKSDSNIDIKKPTAKADFSFPAEDELNNASAIKINQTMDDLCEELRIKKIFPKVYAFKNRMLKQGKNPRSILHTLSRCYAKGIMSGFEGDTPWGYCQKIISVEDGNYNERDHGKTT